jgi:thiosulfate/3-mercaptopyruvate sulfurtransferase
MPIAAATTVGVMGIISVEELSGLLAPSSEHRTPSDTVVCDVRFYLADHAQGRREYEAGHLPDARFVDVHTELADPSITGRGRHPLPDVSEFRALLGRLGILPSTLVIAYDAAGGATAARLWWMLRSVGHSRVAVLDGGYPAWVAAGQPITVDAPHVTPTDYPTLPDWTGTVTADDVAEGVSYGATVIDSRAPERYRGDIEPIDPRAGHIPGARNIFHANNLDASGHFLPLPELIANFAGVGSRPIVYCGSGVTACHNLLAMSLANINEARLYPGSWSEWSSDDTRPASTA